MLKRNRFLAFLACLLSIHLASAQYGNEWIDFSQSYYKLKIVADDFYRVSQSELLAAGFPVSSVPASRIQLFRSGQEVAINVNSNPDGTVNYFEFYGQAIDGKSDAPLFEAGDQPHQFYSLFSDTATYFLTYKLGNETGKRIAFSSDNNASGLTPEPFHLEESLQLFTSSYGAGLRFGSGARFTLSKYDNGEGWTGPFIGKGGVSSYDFVLENFTGAQDPVCDYVLIGGNSLTHNAAISAGPNASSLGLLGNTEFSGWGYTVDSKTIPTASIGGGGELSIEVLREGFPDLSERFAVSYMRVRFPQSFAVAPDENKVFTLTNPAAARAYLRIQSTASSAVSVYDITDPFNAIRLATTGFSDRVEAVVQNFVEGHKVLAVTNTASVPVIEAVSLTAPNVTSSDFLIITDERLRQNGDPVNDYKAYRESPAGGGHTVTISNIDDLFDVFNYGDPSPLAIRNYLQYSAAAGNPDYVFIIGKGRTPNFNYYRGDQSTIHVPTFGLPGSDLSYSLGINTDPDLPGLPIGRLNAFKTEDVTAYLNKVIEMEALPYDVLWRKDFLQLSGGVTQTELNTFERFIEDFTDVVQEDFVGGRAFNAGKQTSESVEFINVTDRVNQGVGYVTFFGHSTGAFTDLEIGRVSDPTFGYQNKGKYPIFLVNGCKAGEIFGGGFTFGEDWMITPDLGAIGFIAHADIATAGNLKRWSDLFYGLGYGDNQFIQEPIGNVLLEVSRQYLDRYGNSDVSLTQTQLMHYQGDPAIRVFGADDPDYQIDEQSLFAEPLSGAQIIASQDTFRLNIVVRNFGRTTPDSLIVQVDRTLPDGMQRTYLNRYERPLRQDTLAFLIPNDQTINNSGLNVLTVRLDPTDSIPEEDETNNVASLELPIFSGNTTHLLPQNYATVQGNQTELVWQSSNLLEDSRSYDVEIDTSPTFSSSNRRTFAVNAEVIGRQTLDLSSLSLADTSTVYWRTRFTNPLPDETSDWVTTSFTVVNNIADGWGQYQIEQLDNAAVTGVEYNTTSNAWEFIQSTLPLEIFTFGTNHPSFVYADIQAIVGGVDFLVTSNSIDPFCRQNTLNGIAFDKESGEPYKPILASTGDIANPEVCGRIPQRIYNFTETDLLTDGRLQVLLDNMRDGDQIVLFTIGDVTFSNWDATLEATLNSVGISSATINNLTDGQAVIFFGRKGAAPGTAIEVITDGTADPITEQSLQLQDDVVGSFSSGSIVTSTIGPARDWSSYSFNLDANTNDTYQLRLLGVDDEGNATPIPEFDRSRAETNDLSSIDPNQYPSLQLEFSFEDEIDLTPPQINFWEINYELPPEGVLLTGNKSLTEFQEGQQIVRSLIYHNPSDVDFTDSLDVDLNLINIASGNTQTSRIKIGPPAAGDSTLFDINFSSFGFGGSNTLVIDVSANENEMYRFNNRLTLANLIEVEPDQTNPILDVTFDGSQLLDGDIVSPTPNILIRMRDDNPFVFKSDTSGINVSLKLPGENRIFQRVPFSDPSMSYTEASQDQDFEITYQPGPLEDGVYGLRVQAQDETGNSAGLEPYEINFEVINESSITHFYPYPNPFSTSCRFVFTLTGSEIPNQIKIQIMTVSGRIVREITQDEIGTIQIGNNITEYAWDGRDEFGDQLANGVYFYRVIVNSNGQTLERRETSADRAFKNGFGKLYILR